MKQAATHHGRKAGDEFDAVLHLLLSDLHHRAVLLLQRERIGAFLRHPRMELQQRRADMSCHTCPLLRRSITVPRLTFTSGMVILVAGFLSSILSMRSFSSLLINGLLINNSVKRFKSKV